MKGKDLEPWDIRHPGYDAWLIDHNVESERTAQLLHALVSRDVRMEMHRRWRAERCNGPSLYTDDIDRRFSKVVADRLAELIDRQ